MSKTHRIGRRALLSGLGGAAVSLPLLNVMSPGGARASDELPCRYIVCFAGVSVGKRNLDYFVPTTTGPGFDLPRALAPLDMVRDDVTLVTGLEIPWDTGSGVPAAGRPKNWHATTKSPLFSGVRTQPGTENVRGPSSDQLVSAVIAGDTRFDSLEYRVQAEGIRAGIARGRMSFGVNSEGRVVPRDPIVSPRLAFDQLFSGFVPDDPVAAALREAERAQDRSVLDLVRRRSDRLASRLGREDRLRLEQHFEEIRALERRIAEITEPTAGTCQLVEDPGEDTPVTISTRRDDIRIGWADEETRAQVMTDLLHMAITCDLTRSASLMYTFFQSFLNSEHVVESGVRADLHELGHGGGTDRDHADAVAWHVKHWARLVQKLRDTPEGDGNLLDRTAVILLFEGGQGLDPSTGNPAVTHSSENMAVLMAGGPGGLSPRGHVISAGGHPTQCLVTAMNAVGVEGGLGEVASGLPELG